jgi:hypothetical protein
MGNFLNIFSGNVGLFHAIVGATINTSFNNDQNWANWARELMVKLRQS